MNTIISGEQQSSQSRVNKQTKKTILFLSFIIQIVLNRFPYSGCDSTSTCKNPFSLVNLSEA